jgi:1-deoxy-D-xylulose-5-phosphate reductoisomerase
LTFEEPDPALFPALELGFRCLETGEDSGAVLNAADEVSVQAFLERAIPFHEIQRTNRAVLALRPRKSGSIAALVEADAWARRAARERVLELSGV